MSGGQFLEQYLRECRDVRRSGSGVPEGSHYLALGNLLNAVGASLRPKVKCILFPSHGAGIPDFGLFTPDQFQRGSAEEPIKGTKPARGVVEVKPASDDAFMTAEGDQVSKYWKAYRQILVTNLRDFLLVGADAEGRQIKLESFSVAADEEGFWRATEHPRAIGQEKGEAFTDFLKRVMLHPAELTAPKDVAWFLASYAREALRRVEARSGVPTLEAIRRALEEALGIKFEDKKGDHFFRSTLVQTLFYGVFSAWVLWRVAHPPNDRKARFDWAHTAEYLRVPVLAELFYQVAYPGWLAELNLTEILDWAGGVLNRIDRTRFFEAFEEHHAVQYFYEPFLEAFDPELRKQLGVWYTPREVVRYMVKRVDQVLRSELGLADGLADPNVYVLDPCCGTGSYLIEVLEVIAATLRSKGGDALTAQEIKAAAINRVFGFEILPAPFVVTHLQVGLLLQRLGAPLAEKKKERAGVYLTNALTGWEPPDGTKPQMLLRFPELMHEREAAEQVKQGTKILVVIGNPPYNGFAGLAVDEERDLAEAYRTAKRAPQPEGQGLNDLYVRFYRMAERRIVEKTRKGIVCFISNYSWLDGRSFSGMRERYLESFDRVWIDCLNGDKYKTGKLTPEGAPDPSIFSTEFNREGIQVGTAITTLVRREKTGKAEPVEFRDLWGKDKRAQLLEEAERSTVAEYQKLEPPLELGLPFRPGVVNDGYLLWPRLPELFPVSFPGVKTSRDEIVVGADKRELMARIETYFDPEISDAELRAIMPTAVVDAAGFNARKTRRYLVERGFKRKYIVPFAYRPFDERWLYWEPETSLLDRKREDYFPHAVDRNVWIAAAEHNRKEFDPPLVSHKLCSLHVIERGANLFPLHLKLQTHAAVEDNTSALAREYLAGFGVGYGAESLFHHNVAILYAPAYASENATALQLDWPRIPLPASKAVLKRSAELGRIMAGLLDLDDADVWKRIPEPSGIGVIAREDGKAIDPEAGELEVTAGWGHGGKAAQ